MKDSIFVLSKVYAKEKKILKTAREKDLIPYKGNHNRVKSRLPRRNFTSQMRLGAYF